MQIHSLVQERGDVQLPMHTGERIYMHGFLQAQGLPDSMARWQPVVDSLLDGIQTDLPIYLMVDQGVVKAGTTHRRGGMHIDGYWNPGELSAHTGHRGHRTIQAGHRTHGSIYAHAAGHGREPGHGCSEIQAGSWSTPFPSSDWEHEGIILASSIQACRALNGICEGEIKEGGAVEIVNTDSMKEVIMAPNRVYAGNVTMLHESLPIEFDCLRTVVRLNVPGWSPTIH